MMDFSFEPIGIIKTCFQEKFGIPRQSGLVPEANGILKLRSNPLYQNAVKDLDQFSHIWVLFAFHDDPSQMWKPQIRPPRLGGTKKVGVFASRSPHRPNRIGLSAVKLLHIDLNAPDGIELHIQGVDILDGTPLLDIKPYLPYSDSIPQANSGWAAEPMTRVHVEFSEKACRDLENYIKTYPRLKQLIVQMLELDPRPAYQSKGESAATDYGFKIYDLDVKWRARDKKFCVTEIIPF